MSVTRLHVKRLVVTVATGQYTRGAERLALRCSELEEPIALFSDIEKQLPNCPRHMDVPYAFKPAALQECSKFARMMLWADACIYPVSSLERIWDHAKQHGAWISLNGWQNSEWTANYAYQYLGVTPEENARIPHVVATAFAVCLEHPAGQGLLYEYIRLGLTTKAFRGPWVNANAFENRTEDPTDWDGKFAAPCGPATTRGHRHDQTVLSVLAHRFGIPLTSPPEFFAYGSAKGAYDSRTVLLADGGY